MDLISITKAKPADLYFVFKIENDAAGIWYSPIDDQNKLLEYIKEDSVYFIKKDDKIIGIVSYRLEADGRAYVNALVILPGYRGQGIAKAAMNLFMKELGDKKSWLAVHPDNAAAVKLYKSFGFIPMETKENYFGDGEPRLIMEKN